MFTRSQIAPLRPDEIPELSQFLIRGFGLPTDVAVMAPDVLRWKFLDSGAAPPTPRSFVARSGEQIIGHLGCCPRSFRVLGPSRREVSSVHFIDWLAAEGSPSVGLLLLKRGFRHFETQYAVGPTEQGHQMSLVAGYQFVGEVGVFQKVLNPFFRLRLTEGGRLRNTLRAARDLWRFASRRSASARAQRVMARPVATFEGEVADLLDRRANPLVVADRSAEHLNYALSYPRPGTTGWLLEAVGRSVGFAVLRVARDDAATVGKIVDCLLDSDDETDWAGAVAALVGELKAQHADVVSAYATTAAFRRALEQNGFTLIRTRPFLLRDPQRLLPQEVPFHLTLLEADLAYL
jgi:hypothetical protein